MMPLVLTQSQVREVDRIAIKQFGMPSIVLMENAGRGCAELLISQQPTGPVTIVAGKGNNAGDGFVIARFLHNHRVDVRILLVSPPEHFPPDAATNWLITQKMHIPFELIGSLEEL
ncbi:MAG: NAD(P)H-hydrate epimerase, partial [Planctomycetaceae bacterium]|nr:NAD(P)H-hydrate epimerase [Planctomycetaceae bacterium]